MSAFLWMHANLHSPICGCQMPPWLSPSMLVNGRHKREQTRPQTHSWTVSNGILKRHGSTTARCSEDHPDSRLPHRSSVNISCSEQGTYPEEVDPLAAASDQQEGPEKTMQQHHAPAALQQSSAVPSPDSKDGAPSTASLGKASSSSSSSSRKTQDKSTFTGATPCREYPHPALEPGASMPAQNEGFNTAVADGNHAKTDVAESKAQQAFGATDCNEEHIAAPEQLAVNSSHQPLTGMAQLGNISAPAQGPGHPRSNRADHGNQPVSQTWSADELPQAALSSRQPGATMTPKTIMGISSHAELSRNSMQPNGCLMLSPVLDIAGKRCWAKIADSCKGQTRPKKTWRSSAGLSAHNTPSL